MKSHFPHPVFMGRVGNQAFLTTMQVEMTPSQFCVTYEKSKWLAVFTEGVIHIRERQIRRV